MVQRSLALAKTSGSNLVEQSFLKNVHVFVKERMKIVEMIHLNKGKIGI